MKNVTRILDTIFNIVVSEGGDGRATWYSKYKQLKDLIGIIDEYNKTNNTGWIIEENGNHLLWGDNQEWVVITDDYDFFKNITHPNELRIEY
jgi:hypothetical protein